jgi:cellulose synthase/poly-beta-1,6-N-acetylglucosamine synthase-like glycosyltransferase
MHRQANATLIISVYRDLDNLQTILKALDYQTVNPTEVVISEDGDCKEIYHWVSTLGQKPYNLVHIRQDDLGFRKNRALNNAIKASTANRLIFIDGDCVPHPNFIEAHSSSDLENAIGVGKRVELSPKLSNQLLKQPEIIRRWRSKRAWILSLLTNPLHLPKNPESGLYSEFLQRRCTLKTKDLSILGCNFSVSKQQLESVNGFDERYTAPGIGEDTDLCYRLKLRGVRFEDLKHKAIQYHLFHHRAYTLNQRNQFLFDQTRLGQDAWTKFGLIRTSNSNEE